MLGLEIILSLAVVVLGIIIIQLGVKAGSQRKEIRNLENELNNVKDAYVDLNKVANNSDRMINNLNKLTPFSTDELVNLLVNGIKVVDSKKAKRVAYKNGNLYYCFKNTSKKILKEECGEVWNYVIKK